jgi:hypothetical protein
MGAPPRRDDPSSRTCSHRGGMRRAAGGLCAELALGVAHARRGSVVSDPVTGRSARQRFLAHLAAVEHPPQILGDADAREPRRGPELGLRNARSLTHERQNLLPVWPHARPTRSSAGANPPAGHRPAAPETHRAPAGRRVPRSETRLREPLRPLEGVRIREPVGAAHPAVSAAARGWSQVDLPSPSPPVADRERIHPTPTLACAGARHQTVAAPPAAGPRVTRQAASARIASRQAMIRRGPMYARFRHRGECEPCAEHVGAHVLRPGLIPSWPKWRSSNRSRPSGRRNATAAGRVWRRGANAREASGTPSVCWLTDRPGRRRAAGTARS